MIQLVVPRQQQPVSVSQLLARERQQPRTPALTCNEQGCPAVSHLVPSTLVGTPGQVLLVHLLRNVAGVGVDANGVALQGKVLTPLQVTDANDAEWRGLSLRAVLAHREAGGRHWIAYLHKVGQWWKVDSARRVIPQCNPFEDQLGPGHGQQGFTLDVLMFGQ